MSKHAKKAAKKITKNLAGTEVAAATNIAYSEAPRAALRVAEYIQPGDYSRENSLFDALDEGVKYGAATGAAAGFALGGPTGAIAGAAVLAPLAGAANMGYRAVQYIREQQSVNEEMRNEENDSDSEQQSCTVSFEKSLS